MFEFVYLLFTMTYLLFNKEIVSDIDKAQI